MNVIILSHERSLNKAQGLLNAYKDTNCTLVVDSTPRYDVKPYAHYANNVVIDRYFDLINITSQIKSCDVIWCVSENLLPLQSQLESYYGINNLTPFAAEILSNKQKFDDFCRNIGLGNHVPNSITPTFHNHLKKLGNNEIFSKPDIGTGGNVFFPGDNQNTPSVEYRRWNNRHHFLSYLKDNKIHNDFFSINQTGIYTDRFNNKACRIMFQEYFWSEKPTVAPYGYIKDGQAHILFYVKCSKVNFGDSIDINEDPNQSHKTSRTSDIGRDRAVWITKPHEVDKTFHAFSQYFLDTIVKNLKIKNMFFAGPDFHITKNNIIAIDFNPRLGQFINLLDGVNNFGIIKNILQDKAVNIKNNLLWGCATLKPGKIKSLANINSVSTYLNAENTKLEVGQEIPVFQNLQNKDFNINLNVTGSNEQELFTNYKSVNQLLQKCISY
jgi:hypothetical protein